MAPILSAAAALPDGSMRFTASGEPNVYALEFSTDLKAWTVVTNLYGSEIEFTHLSSGGRGFYRVSRPP
jgi:hypothetical protein